MSEPDLFLIIGVINTGTARWSYTPVRSVFSPEERYLQTLRTISSIRDLCDNSIIILVDCSEITPAMTTSLSSKVEHFVQLYDDMEARTICLSSSKKGHGEAIETAKALSYIKNKGLIFNRLFKISGRYWLTDMFSKSSFSESIFTFRKLEHGVHSTVLYSVPYTMFNEYVAAIGYCCTIYDTSSKIYGWEELFPPACNPKLTVARTGVAGRVGIDNNYYEG